MLGLLFYILSLTPSNLASEIVWPIKWLRHVLVILSVSHISWVCAVILMLFMGGWGGYFACICSWTGCMYYHRSNTVTSQMSACLLPLPTPKSAITPIPPLSSFSSKISPWALGRPTSASAARTYFVFVLIWLYVFWLVCVTLSVSQILCPSSRQMMTSWTSRWILVTCHQILKQ